MSIDISLLNPPNVIEQIDYETLLANNKTVLLGLYPAAADIIDNEAEPLVKLLEAFAYRELVLRQRINESALAIMVAYAHGKDLDDVAWDRYRLKRLTITPTTETEPAIYESDDALRQRCVQSVNAVSVAGPQPYFESLAKSAHGDVADVRAASPAPGTVNVYVLSHSNYGITPETVLAAVDAVVNSGSKRPMTIDVNTLQSPVTAVPVVAVLKLSSTAAAGADNVLADATAAITAFAATRTIGQRMAISKLHSILHVEGVNEVILESPTADVTPPAIGTAIITSIAISVAADE